MLTRTLILTLLISVQTSFSQDYTSYFTGNTTDLDTIGQGGVCLMGGATEDDNGAIWFLERANQGDVLVIRASGSDGYNNYFYSGLGVTVNSVETIVFNNANASNDTYVQQAIKDAEAIWIAGGDQWDYVSYWRDTPVDSLINDIIQNKSAVIGGTSAGMAIQGEYYFTAENGTITSAAALTNPFDSDITISSLPFINNDYLNDVITDTHYDDPDRKGRHVSFMARMVEEGNFSAKGIACDEYTAVCIDHMGQAKVFGGFPTYDDNAYFIQVNCSNLDTGAEPEDCSAGNPLNWNRNQYALQVYQIKGDAGGTNAFDLNDWESASGGTWNAWWVDNGSFQEASGSQIICPNSLLENSSEISVYPNPFLDQVSVQLLEPSILTIKGLNGELVQDFGPLNGKISLDLSHLANGSYILYIQGDSEVHSTLLLK